MGNAEEIPEVVEEGVVVNEVKLDDDGNPIEPEIRLDDDGNPIEAPKELEPWQLTEDAGSEDHPDVPVATHIRMKEKLKGRLKDRDTELDTLREKVAALESGATSVSTEPPPRPKAEDYDTDELHEEALEDWRDQKADIRAAGRDNTRSSDESRRKQNDKVSADVESHYSRTAELVESSGISSDMFKEADTSVREAVEAVMPKRGDGITDFIIHVLGKGSEKVIYFLGRNKAARAEFQSLLVEDPEGNKAMVYLGQQKERLNNPKKARSKAPKPAAKAQGDAIVKQSEAALKKKYTAAHGGGKGQIAYNLKKQAKAQGIDVSAW